MSKKTTSKKEATTYYALGLHMHQPPGNLALLIEHNDWEAQQIIHCYARAAEYAHKTKGVGCFHVGFSGTLLEQFQDPSIIKRYQRYVDIPRMLENYRQADNIEIIGMGYYHPIFPLIPREDWPEHLAKGRDIAQALFGQAPKGFWPSEMAFCMELIPDLKKAGYEYIVVDHVHVQPEDAENVDSFQPYWAEHDGQRIVVIPRNRDISNAQESGLNPEWFLNELAHKRQEGRTTAQAPLLTTWSDGENGGWFRQMDPQSGFWGYFYEPLTKQIQQGQAPVEMVSLSDYIAQHPPQRKAVVRTGAWNVGSTSGYDFAQWNGSEAQKEAIKVLFDMSGRYWELQRKKLPAGQQRHLETARHLILDAQTSCYLFWGSAWLPKLYDKLQAAQDSLNQVTA
jgi:alpha-amylase/alpha-mannosidase (GH57 family)